MTEARHADVLVVGAGVIGVACADALARRGARVTVIDKGDVGHGCSYGNAGWITPCFALPLPMPGVLLKSVGWMLDPNSPLYIQPRLDLDLAKWLLRFARSTNRALMMKSVAALVGLAKYSLDAFRELDAESPRFGFEQKGLLMVAESPAGLDAACEEMDLVARHNVPGSVLSAADVREIEPAVVGKAIAGGVFFLEEAHCEPLAAVQALAARAAANGAAFLTGTEVFDIDCDRNRIRRVHTTRGQITADEIVLATGSWSKELGCKLGLQIPVLSGKGYAMSVVGMDPAPHVPIMFLDKKCAVTPREGSVRIAGTLELVDMDESITASRVMALARSASEYLNIPANPPIETWRGLRPCTPDGVPIIGRPRRLENLIIATGHQMLGLTTAPATGTLVADFVTRTSPTFDPEPFRATRF